MSGPGDAGRLPRGLRWTGPGATFVLALLCAVLAGALLLAAYGEDDRPGRPTAEDPITSAQTRAETLEAAPDLAARLLSYDWRGIEGQAERTRDLLTAGFAEEYADSLAGLAEEVVAQRVSVTATVRDAGVVAAGPDRGVALVYLDQTSTTQGSAGQRRDQVRVLVTVTRDGSRWRVSRVDAF